jgi:FXSXX-COOH protein
VDATSSLPEVGPDAEAWAPLVEVSHRPIADLLAGGADPALARSVQRLVRSLDDPDGVISAFNSFVS